METTVIYMPISTHFTSLLICFHYSTFAIMLKIASYNQYAKIRGDLSLPQDFLLQIDASTSSQPCEIFGVHPNMPFLKKLYDEKDASFVAGIGVLSAPVTKIDYKRKTKTTLYAHNASKCVCFCFYSPNIFGTSLLSIF